MEDLRDAVAFHQLLLNSEGASSQTQRLYLYYECLFLDFLSSRKLKPLIDELNPGRVREFLVWYRNKPHPRRTRNGEVATRAAAGMLKRLGAVCEEQGITEHNPLQKLKRPRAAHFSRKPFSDKELNRLWGACFRTMHPERDEALFLLLLGTGMRIGEACTLRVDKIDLDQRQVRVGLEGKSRRERLVPIGDSEKRDGGRLVRSLRRYLAVRGSGAGEEYLFMARDGRKLTAVGGNDVIKRIAELAGVEDAYPHRLRHTFCTHYLTAYPGDELGLRRIVGHLSHDVLTDYVHFAETTIAERSGRASPVETVLTRTPVMLTGTDGRPRQARQAQIGERPQTSKHEDRA